MRKHWDRRRNNRNPREQNPKWLQKRTRTRYVRNPPQARNGHRVPPYGGDVETGRRITRNIPPGKLNKKNRTKTNVPRKIKIRNRENRINILEGGGDLDVN